MIIFIDESIANLDEHTTTGGHMKQPRDFVDDSQNGRRFLQGAVIAVVASAVMVWAVSELLGLLMATAKAVP